MNADLLLDAFGLIDDRFIQPEEKPKVISWRRTLTVLVAAVMTAVLCIGTAMAVSEGFRDFMFSIFRLETPDVPPATEETHPTEPGLHEMDVINIDGQVGAYYFSSGGYLAVCDGGLYTSEWTEAGKAPADPAFWEITFDGIREVQNTRVDFPFTHGGKTFRILFDFAVLNGKPAIRVWPENLDLEPVGYGWNVQPLGSRRDAVLLTIPVSTGTDYTHDLFLLNLKTLEAAPLISGLPLLVDACWVTEDLRCAIIAGCDPASYQFSYWLYDLESGEISNLPDNTRSAWFLDDHTLAYREELENGQFRLIRCHIPTGASQVILDDVSGKQYRPIRNHWAEGAHGLLYGNGGTVTLVNFRTGAQMELTGLNAEHLTCDESPDGKRVMLGYRENDGFTSLGILDPETGVLKLLDREVSGSESFVGWLDNDTLVITAHDIPDPELNFTPGDGYYVYVYRFREEEKEPLPTDPVSPAENDFVRVTDYIPDVIVDLRYATPRNFTGEVIYDFTDVWLRYGTVKKLMQVQAELREHGLRLKIWDGFRPVSAQFRLWAVCPDSRYVANPNNGFSSHSRGGTVDVTLAYTDGRELEMPTGFDDFSLMADRDYSDCTATAAANAEYLEDVMVSNGFTPYQAEWWHFTDTHTYPVEHGFTP